MQGPALQLERRNVAPASTSLPAGAEQHLVFVSLGPGQVELERAGESIRHELKLGSVAVYPAGLPIRWSWRMPLSYSVMALDPKFLNYVACRIYGAVPGDFELLPAERSLDLGIAGLLGTLGSEAAGAGPDSSLYRESLANALSAHLLRYYGRWTRGGPARRDVQAERPTSLPEPVARAVRYIHEHHAQDIGLRDIAEAGRLSSFHLARVFKRNMGMAPHQYLVQVRVQSAHSLLSMSAEKRSLAEVAAAAGFSDQSHLTRHFKRAFGVTPGQLLSAGRDVGRAPRTGRLPGR
jgi:AraC family transcriptional regulator